MFLYINTQPFKGTFLGLNSLKIYNANNCATAQKRYGNNKKAEISMLQRMQSPTDNHDGKFTFSEAMKNFGKGLASPITSMFASTKGFLTGVGMIAGSAALVIATGGAATPFLVMAGAVMGGMQTIQAGYKIMKAKNGDDIEKAFFDIGGATSTIGLSIYGAKSSLGQAGIEAKNLSPLNATIKCFKSAKALAQESLMTFKTGFYKINFSTFMKNMKQPKELKALSEKLFKEGQEQKGEVFQEIKNIFPEKYHSSLECRVKCKSSIYDKLVARFKKTISSGNNKSSAIEEEAKAIVNDLHGFRLTPKDTSAKGINEIFSYIVNAIEDERICITQVKNYTSASGEHYFSTEQCEAIKAACARRGIIFDLIEKPKPSGYCAVQLKIQHKNGALGELQIRGKLVNEVDAGEHLFYDLKQGKDIFKSNNQRGELLYHLEKAIKKLTPEELLEYQEYRKQSYKYARQKEMGLNPEKPQLPKCCDNILSMESLSELCEKSKALPEVQKEIFSLLPQMAFYSGFSEKNQKA